MAVLGLRFCGRTFSSCGKRGPLFIVVHGPLSVAASLVAEHRLQTRRLSNCGSRGPAAPRHVGSSQTRSRTRVPCIGRRTLNHCATREALPNILKRFNTNPSQTLPKNCRGRNTPKFILQSHHQKIIREEIKQTIRSRTRLTSIEITRIILDTRTMSQFA